MRATFRIYPAAARIGTDPAAARRLSSPLLSLSLSRSLARPRPVVRRSSARPRVGDVAVRPVLPTRQGRGYKYPTTLARCVRETSDAVLEKKTGRQRKKVKPSEKTLQLEKDLRSGSVAMSKEDKTSLGAALRASKKKDRDNRTKQIITVMTREYVAGNVKGVSECMNELSNSSKFCSVQPMHHITHDSQGKVKVLGGFKTSTEATDLWTEKMEVRFAKREGDDRCEMTVTRTLKMILIILILI